MDPCKDAGALGGKQVTQQPPSSRLRTAAEAAKPCCLQLSGTQFFLEHTSSTNPLKARTSVHFHPCHHHYIPVDANKSLKEAEMSGYRKHACGHHSRRTQSLELCMMAAGGDQLLRAISLEFANYPCEFPIHHMQ